MQIAVIGNERRHMFHLNSYINSFNISEFEFIYFL